MFHTLRDRRFAALVFGIAIPANVLLQAFVSYLGALTLNALGASTADIGRTLMLYFLCIAAVGPLGGRLAEAGASAIVIVLAGATMAGASLTLVALSPSALTMVVAMLVSGAGHGLVRGAQVSLAIAMAETELARLGPVTVLGALRTFERLGSIVGLLLIAGLAGYAGYAPAIGAVAIWSLAGAALFALIFVPRSLTRGKIAE
jgi:hypothetical protein